MIVFRNSVLDISFGLIEEILNEKIPIIFENNNKPSFYVLPFYGSSNAYGRLKKQINNIYSREWKEIVSTKIKKQYALLKKYNLAKNISLKHYIERIDDEDSLNVEGTFAKMYFNRLFGKGFDRRKDSKVNSLLNYGYGVLASYITCNLVYKGFNTIVGIHHRSETNPYNLTYDLIEIFRSYIDEIVYLNKENDLSKEMRNILVNVLNGKFIYEKKTFDISTFIGNYIDLVFANKFSYKKVSYGQ